MIIGIAGPASPEALAHHLHPRDAARTRPGDSGIPVQLLVDGLCAHGHTVALHTLDPSADKIEELCGDRLTIMVGPYRARHRMRDFFAAERRALVTMMKVHPVQVMHAHWTYEYALAALKAAVAPVVTTAHDWAPTILACQPTPYRFGRLPMNLAVLARAGRFIAPTQRLASRIERLSRRPCAVVPHGLPANMFTATARSCPQGPRSWFASTRDLPRADARMSARRCGPSP